MFDNYFNLLIEEVKLKIKSIEVEIREFEYKLEGCDNSSDKREWTYKVDKLYADILSCEEFIGQIQDAIEAENIDDVISSFGPLD